MSLFRIVFELNKVVITKNENFIKKRLCEKSFNLNVMNAPLVKSNFLKL